MKWQYASGYWSHLKVEGNKSPLLSLLSSVSVYARVCASEVPYVVILHCFNV